VRVALDYYLDNIVDGCKCGVFFPACLRRLLQMPPSCTACVLSAGLPHRKPQIVLHMASQVTQPTVTGTHATAVVYACWPVVVNLTQPLHQT
jgi:hypothetical protein